jgi:hypothetical protein
MLAISRLETPKFDLPLSSPGLDLQQRTFAVHSAVAQKNVMWLDMIKIAVEAGDWASDPGAKSSDGA